MDRRGFLKALTSAAVALGYAATAGPSDVVALLQSADPVVSEVGALRTIDWMTREVARRISLEMGPMTLRDSGYIDMETPHQFSVHLGLSEIDNGLTEHDLAQRFLAPIAASFSTRMREEGVTRCGILPLPSHAEFACVVKHPELGVSVRGIQAYDVYTQLLRFDVLAG